MYADDLLLISSTCSDFRRMLRTLGLFIKPRVYYRPLPSLLMPRYFSDTGIPRIPIQLPYVHVQIIIVTD